MTPAQALSPKPLPATTRGRIVLRLTGDLAELRGVKRAQEQVLRERQLIYDAIERLEDPTRNEIAADTGINPDVVTARLNWLSTHNLVQCWRGGGEVVWRIAKRSTK